MSSTIKSNILAEIFAEIVDSIRVTGTITDFIEIDASYTIFDSVNCLRKSEIITINDVKYIVSAADATTFTIEEIGIGTGADEYISLAPYYFHGHIKDIADTLATIQNDNNKVAAYQNYPFIALIHDFEEDRSNNGFDYIARNVMILIVHFTRQDYKPGSRYDEVFIPVLIPIYESLMKAIKRSKYFTIGKEGLKHTKIDRLFFGSSLSGNKNVLNDYSDAIEIKNMDLKVNRKNC